MTRAIVYDITRLFVAAAAPAPRGIDRIDLAIASHLFDTWPGKVDGCMPTALGVRLFDRAWVRRGLACLQELWREERAGAPDPALARVARLLAQGAGAPVDPGGPARPPAWRGLAAMLRRTGLSLGRSAVRHAPARALYVNVGQLTWAMPVMVHWLRRRPDLGGLFMVHDMIPLEYPDLVVPMARRCHRWLMQALARHASALLLTTRAASDSVLRALGRSSITTDIGPLPVPLVFLQPAEPDPSLLGRVYFVICGAIETRKNHAVLLAAWEALVSRHGEDAPKLVIAGSPAHGGAALLGAIRAQHRLRRHVILANALGSVGLARLVAHARALLMPSLAEGYGMPVAEALALGTPVIASDLAAHRETAQGCALLCPPHEAQAWRAAIEKLAFDPEFHQAVRARAAAFRPVTGAAYCARLDAFLQRL